jgi:ribosomal protein L17
MANRRELKRNINGLLGDVIDECYISLLNNKGKNEKEVEKIVDEVVDLANDLIARTNASKYIKNKKEVKKHFAAIKEELGEKVIAYVDKINAL